VENPLPISTLREREEMGDVLHRTKLATEANWVI